MPFSGGGLELDILIWGIGEKTRQVLETGISGGARIIGVVCPNSVHGKGQWDGLPLYSPEDMPDKYDVLFVIEAADEKTLDQFEKMGISSDKLCFFQPPVKCLVNKRENFKKCASILQQQALIMVPGYGEDEEHNFVKNDLLRYNQMHPRESMRYDEKERKFIYADKYAEAGEIKNYFWQDLWAAQLIYKNNPGKHYDIGSRVDGFIAHLLSFRKDVTLIDIRPLEKTVPGLGFICADATNLEGIEDDSIESLSALCSLEHFGLGRYGDEIDPEACFKAFDAIQRKVMPGGMAYISVPVGREHVEFNAHRIFKATTIIDAFSQMELVRFDAADTNELKRDVDIHQYDDRADSGCRVFGLFQFRKREK